jgi:ABC-type Fe3+/spermidine/putrescine transport system ATPase subunit
MESILKLQGLKIKRENWSLEVPDLSISSDEVLILDAPSGFGKTTVVKALLGIEPCQGQIILGSTRLDLLPVHERKIGVVFQDQALFTHLSALENVMSGLRLQGLPQAESQVRAESALGRLGLADRKRARVTELSGGERQRVAILRALIWKPRLWILDEPLQGLDDQARAQVIAYLTEWRVENRVPVLWVDHQSLPPPEWGRAIRLQKRSHTIQGESNAKEVAHRFELAPK